MNTIATAGITACFGILVLVAGQIISKWLIEPMHEQRKTIGEIAYNLILLGNAGSSFSNIKLEGERISSAAEPREATLTVRRLASQLRSSLVSIPCYDALAKTGCIHKREVVMEASREMIGWSNDIWGGVGQSDRTKRIAELLGVDF
jgi:hypothetical protein